MKLVTQSALAALLIAFSFSQSCLAATQSAALSVSAVVQSSLTLNIVLNRVDPASGDAESPTTSMNFGSLTPDSNGGMKVPYYFKAYINANTQSLPYTITQSGTPVSNGSATLPTTACRVVPTYNPTDNGGAPLVGTLGSPGSWVGPRTVYTSDAAGSPRTVSVVYALIGDPAYGGGLNGEPLNFIPNTQPAGAYGGSVTFTLTA